MPHAQFLWWGQGVGASLGLGPDDVLYNGLPLFHTNAINAFFQAVVTGGTFVLGRHFSVREYWRRVADADATVVYLLGAMVAMLAGRSPSPHDRAHRATRALSPATPERLWRPFRERFGVELIDGFGTTETNLVLGTVPGDRRAGYLGTVMPGYDALVVDPAGGPVRTAPPANCWCAPNSTAPSRSATSVTRPPRPEHGWPRATAWCGRPTAGSDSSTGSRT